MLFQGIIELNKSIYPLANTVFVYTDNIYGRIIRYIYRHLIITVGYLYRLSI